jgi:hypothetical protein
MRKTIEGTTYNTATSARLATAQWTEDDGRVCYGTLYQPRSGKFFLAIEWADRGGRWCGEIEPLTPERAAAVFEAMATKLSGMVLLDPFGRGGAQREVGYRLRMPGAMKHPIEIAARRAGMSINGWLMRTVEEALAAQPDAPMIRTAVVEHGRP